MTCFGMNEKYMVRLFDFVRVTSIALECWLVNAPKELKVASSITPATFSLVH